MIKSTAMAEKEKNQGKSKSPEPTTKREILRYLHLELFGHNAQRHIW